MSEPTTTTVDSTSPPKHPWAELGAERFELLRLAPLPTERELGPRPLRFVELGQVERHSQQQSLLRLYVQVPGQPRSRRQNLLEVWADHRSKEIRFGPDSGLQLDPANRGLGRFLLARAIGWAQKRWSHYLVEGAALPSEALSDEQRLRRDHCLLTLGFDVHYPQERGARPSYSAPRVSALRADWNQEKVQLISLDDAAAMLEQADRNLLAQQGQIVQLQQRIGRLRREDGALRFTIVCLIAFALFQAGLLIWMATR